MSALVHPVLTKATFKYFPSKWNRHLKPIDTNLYLQLQLLQLQLQLQVQVQQPLQQQLQQLLLLILLPLQLQLLLQFQLQLKVIINKSFGEVSLVEQDKIECVSVAYLKKYLNVEAKIYDFFTFILNNFLVQTL